MFLWTGTMNWRVFLAHWMIFDFLISKCTQLPGKKEMQPQARCSAGLKEPVVGRTKDRRREVRKRRRNKERKGEK